MPNSSDHVQLVSRQALAVRISRRVLGVIVGLAIVVILDFLAEYLRIVISLRSDLFGRGLHPQVTAAYALSYFAMSAAEAWIGTITVRWIDRASTRWERCVPALVLIAIYLVNLRVGEGKAIELAAIAGFFTGAVVGSWPRVLDVLIRRRRST